MITSSQPLAALSRWAPLAMLAASVVIGALLSNVFPAHFASSIPLTIVLFTGRLALAIIDPPLGPRAGAAFIAVNLAVTLAGSMFNPLLSIYGFAGYVDLERYIPTRFRMPAVIATALVIAAGQTGGLPGVVGLPLLYVLLAAVNVAIALMMFGRARDRERQMREREEAAVALARAHEANAELHRQLADSARERGVAEERARLSRELHDTVAQGIVGVIRQLDAIDETALDAEARARVERAASAARDCLVDARRAVRELAPRELSERPFLDAVHDVARTWARANRIAIEADLEDAPETSPHESTVLRIVQEALTNIARHASARSVRLTLAASGEGLELAIDDDGVGFDPAKPTAGLGLAGMAARIREVSGTFEIDSAPHEGCRIMVRIP